MKREGSSSNDGDIRVSPRDNALVIEESVAVTSILDSDNTKNQETDKSKNNSDECATVRKDGTIKRKAKKELFDNYGKQFFTMTETILSASRDTNNGTTQTDKQPSSSSLTDASLVDATRSPAPSSSPPNESAQDDNHDRPGAYAVAGRAPGTPPAWGRRNRRVSRTVERVRNSIFTIRATVVEESGNESLPTVYPTDVRSAASIKRKRRKLVLLVSILVCSLIGLTVALVVTQVGGKESQTPVIDENWDAKESLKCGVPYSTEGFGVQNGSDYYGLCVDLCYAVAAALFGESYRDRVILFGLRVDSDFSALKKKEVDLLARQRTHTMERQVYIDGLNTGFAFSIPYFYSGLVFAGRPFFVTCADNKNTTAGCAQLKICVMADTTHTGVVRGLFPEENIVQVKVSTLDDVYAYINTNSCNVITGEQPTVATTTVKKRGITGPYEVGRNVFSKEPLAVVTHNDEPQWSDFVNWVLHGLMAAEQNNITRTRANEMPTTNVFGEKFKNMFVDSVKAVGNYGEIYTRHLEAIVPRQGMNLINDGTSGLIYSHPFGRLLEGASAGHVEGGILEEIFQRGYLRCGIIEQNFMGEITPKKVTPNGMGADYCNALAAGIFQHNSETAMNNRTKIVPTSPVEATSLLNRKEVDVIGLVAVNLVNDVLANMSFSQPIYYDSQGDPFALATSQYDAQWSSFVYWTVSATFYAEENSITQESKDKMPLLNHFGPHHKMMMRHIIDAVGSYGDIFERNADTLGPRNGLHSLNLLNSKSGPQLYPFPGIFD